MSSEELHLKGFSICPGIAIARPFYFTCVDEKVPEFTVSDEEIDHEVARYQKAVKSSKRDILHLQRRLYREGGTESAAILGTHLEMMHDPLITTQMEERIRSLGKNTEFVFKSVMGEYEEKFSKITDQFFRERLKDVQDVSRRIIGHLGHQTPPSLGTISSPSVIFAHELSPSHTAEVNKECVEAFVTRSGAETSHVAIIARARGIPFVSNVDFPDLSHKPTVIVDGREGRVIINPSEETLATYEAKKKRLQVRSQGLQDKAELETETYDGYKVRLSANVEMVTELDMLSLYGGEGVGLFRSEFLFLAEDTFPSEEDQFNAYRKIVEKVGEYPACIRTFDIGGDKFGNFHPTRYEQNPFLGCRAIRLMLKEPDVFRTQVRAILRASAFGEVSILLPMISDVSELREAKGLIEEVKGELAAQQIPFARNIRVGCMVEVPSAALTVDILAKESDFLSIGTNDLVQYTMAVDRGNAMMSYLYTPMHLSVVRLVNLIVQESIKEQTPVCVCGEVAANPLYVPLLLGLGVHELSVSAPALPAVKDLIRHLSILEATQLAERVLSLSTSEEIECALQAFHGTLGLEENF